MGATGAQVGAHVTGCRACHRPGACSPLTTACASTRLLRAVSSWQPKHIRDAVVSEPWSDTPLLLIHLRFGWRRWHRLHGFVQDTPYLFVRTSQAIAPSRACWCIYARPFFFLRTLISIHFLFNPSCSFSVPAFLFNPLCLISIPVCHFNPCVSFQPLMFLSNPCFSFQPLRFFSIPAFHSNPICFVSIPAFLSNPCVSFRSLVCPRL